MIYKQFGKTGFKVSAVGYGGMRFDLSRSDEENAKLILYAYEKGINFFDTAPGYSDDRSEKIYGIAFKELKSERDKFFVCTKGMPEKFDTASKAKDAVDRSLERLGLDYLDFYYVWCVRKMEHYHLATKPGGQYDGLKEYQEQGKIKHISISSHLPGDEIKTILDEDKFAGVLLGMNILNFPYRWSAVQAAYDDGYGVVAMNPLAGGIIPQHEDRLTFLASENETPTQAALRFCISAPQITVTLPGFTTKEHIDMACEAADRSEQFSMEQIEEIRHNISKGMNSLCTACGYCVDKCPKKIPIPSYMQIYNDQILEGSSDKKMAELMVHHHLWGMLPDRLADASDCIRCHQCEDACTQHLRIMDRLKEMSKWEEKAYEMEKEQEEKQNES